MKRCPNVQTDAVHCALSLRIKEASSHAEKSERRQLGIPEGFQGAVRVDTKDQKEQMHRICFFDLLCIFKLFFQ